MVIKYNELKKLFEANGQAMMAKDILSTIVPGTWIDSEDTPVKEFIVVEA